MTQKAKQLSAFGWGGGGGNAGCSEEGTFEDNLSEWWTEDGKGISKSEKVEVHVF